MQMMEKSNKFRELLLERMAGWVSYFVLSSINCILDRIQAREIWHLPIFTSRRVITEKSLWRLKLYRCSFLLKRQVSFCVVRLLRCDFAQWNQRQATGHQSFNSINEKITLTWIGIPYIIRHRPLKWMNDHNFPEKDGESVTLLQMELIRSCHLRH